MKKVLPQAFFNRDTKLVAQELLGKFLVRKFGKKEIVLMITETEAYDGLHDLASHASKGKTARTEIMFGRPGNFYVYLVYGMYHMLNVVTREHGYPAAVLIRAVKLKKEVNPLTNSYELVSGPGKLTKFLKIDKKFNGAAAAAPTGLWFEDRGVVVPKSRIKKLSRIGVNYAGAIWSAKKWRFRLL